MLQSVHVAVVHRVGFQKRNSLYTDFLHCSGNDLQSLPCASVDGDYAVLVVELVKDIHLKTKSKIPVKLAGLVNTSPIGQYDQEMHKRYASFGDRL